MEKTEGIVLRSQDYQERHRIITLFTPHGLLSLIVKNISRKNARLLSLTTVFTHAEYHFQRGKTELLTFTDGAILSENLNLRASLTSIQTAAALTQTILSSQFPNKPAPALFFLYRSYLKQVPAVAPEPLLSSFTLKLLTYEGQLSLTSHCTHCPERPAHILDGGESLCANHSTLAPLHFTPLEWALLHELQTAQNFSALHTLALPPELPPKITALFNALTHPI